MNKWIFLLLLLGGSLWAGPNRYSVVTLENETPFRIYYSYRWGEGEKEWRNSIKPYGIYVHWWELRHGGKEWAPWFYLQIDGQSDWHKLGSFFAPGKRSRDGRQYFFESKDTGDNIHEIQITSRLYTH